MAGLLLLEIVPGFYRSVEAGESVALVFTVIVKDYFVLWEETWSDDLNVEFCFVDFEDLRL